MKIDPRVFNDVILTTDTTFIMHGSLGPVKAYVNKNNYIIVPNRNSDIVFRDMLGVALFRDIQRWYGVRCTINGLGPFEDINSILTFLSNRMTEGMKITDDKGTPIESFILP